MTNSDRVRFAAPRGGLSGPSHVARDDRLGSCPSRPGPRSSGRRRRGGGGGCDARVARPLLALLSCALAAGLVPGAEAVSRPVAKGVQRSAQAVADADQPAAHESPQSSRSAPDDSLDYRQLRKSLGSERAGEKEPSDKILGLPTDEFYAPAAPSGLKTVWNSPLLIKAIEKYANGVKLNQGGAIWLFIVVLGIVGFDWNRLVSWHNVDIVILPLLCFFLVDLISVGENPDEPGRRTLAGLMFAGIFLISSYWLVRCLVGAFRRPGPPRAPALRLAALVPLTLLCVGLNITLVLTNRPDDCGYYSNIGAKRLLDTGLFPYGDPMLRGGAAATYGPVLHLSHIPFQLLLPEAAAARETPPQTATPTSAVSRSAFVQPSVLATQLCALAYHLIAVVALFLIGRQMAGGGTGWVLICLYTASAYVMGLGGSETLICGMTFISHIAPAAAMLAAFALLAHPALAGAMLGLATGILFFPAFFVPVWFGYYFWQRRRDAFRFILGYAVVTLPIATMVALMTQSTETESVLDVFLSSTVAHQEHPDAYGASPFGFWGTHPSARAFWHGPLVEGWFLSKPAFLLFVALVALSFFLAKGRTRTQFAFLIAALAIAVQLWKSHATGTYVEWYLPFLLIGLFTADKAAASHAVRHEQRGSATSNSDPTANVAKPRV